MLVAVGAEELEIDTADAAARRCVAALSLSGSGCFSCSDSMVFIQKSPLVLAKTILARSGETKAS